MSAELKWQKEDQKKEKLDKKLKKRKLERKDNATFTVKHRQPCQDCRKKAVGYCNRSLRILTAESYAIALLELSAIHLAERKLQELATVINQLTRTLRNICFRLLHIQEMRQISYFSHSLSVTCSMDIKNKEVRIEDKEGSPSLTVAAKRISITSINA